MHQCYEVHFYYTQYMNQMSIQFLFFSKILRDRWRSRIANTFPTCHIATLQTVGMGVDLRERSSNGREIRPCPWWADCFRAIAISSA